MLIIGKKLSPYALLSISGLLAASDQAVKWLVQQSMAYGEYVSVTPFFNWVHLWNTGAAYSLFANGGGWQRYFFIGIAVVVSIFLIKLILERADLGQRLNRPLILECCLSRPQHLAHHFARDLQLSADRLDRLAINKVRPAYPGNRLHNKHPKTGSR